MTYDATSFFMPLTDDDMVCLTFLYLFNINHIIILSWYVGNCNPYASFKTMYTIFITKLVCILGHTQHATQQCCRPSATVLEYIMLPFFTLIVEYFLLASETHGRADEEEARSMGRNH